MAATSSRSLSPRSVFLLAAIAEFAGSFLFGTTVAAAIVKNIVQSSPMTPNVLLVAIISAIAWGLAAGFLGLLSISTDGLVGGLVGAVTTESGAQALIVGRSIKITVA